MNPTLRRGDRGDEVVRCQELLSAKGFHATADGDFGPKTEDTVKQFQASFELAVDGVVGSGTWSALERAQTPTRKEDIGDDSALDEQQTWCVGQIPAGTPSSRSSVLRAAILDLGADEIPDGSNAGMEILHLVDGYNEYWKTGDSKRYPWCMMACSSWIGIGLGLGTESRSMPWASHPFHAFFGGAAQCEDWAKKQGCFVSADNPAPAASVFTMARGGSGSDPSGSARAGHVGLVLCDNGDGTLTTIEGNVSNGVRAKKRNKSDLHGYVEWWRG